MAKKDYKESVLKAAIIVVLLYIAIPTIDDVFAIPILAYFLGLPLLVMITIYYGVAWALVALAEVVL